MILTDSLQAMLSPKSIVIIGASGNTKKIGYKPISNLKEINYRGKVLLVNPKYEEIAGFPSYTDTDKLPLGIDLALVSINSSGVLEVLEKLNERQVKSAIILSSGYAEIGSEGAKLENQLTNFSERTGMKICGPNTIGLANFRENTLASFSSLKPYKTDPIAFVTQSGALGTLTYTLAQEMGFGFHYFVASGNEAGTDFFEYVEYFSKQKDIKVVGGYLEGARDYQKMDAAIESCIKHNKPLVLMKVGNSKKGAIAATSHTASVAGNSTIYANYLKHKNVVQVSDEEELVDTISVFSNTSIPNKKGGVALVTQSGGSGIIMADECEKYDLPFAELSEETKLELKKSLPAFSSVSNPVDITAQVAQQPDQIVEALDITLKDDNVESVILYLQMTDDKFLPILDDLTEIIQKTDKRVIFCWAGILPETKNKLFTSYNLCWVPTPSRSVKALANVTNYYRKQSNIQNNSKQEIESRITPKNISPIEGSLNEKESKGLFKQYSISVPDGELVTSKEGLGSLSIKYPWVMKAVSSKVKHKSDYGLVKLNITTKEEAKKSYEEITSNYQTSIGSNSLEGILVEEMVPEGVEVIVGVVKDPIFGPCVMFGLGGIFVEVLKDVAILPAPLNYKEAESMVKSIKNYEILQGVRGNHYDITNLIETIVKVSELSIDKQDSMIECDINPIIVHSKGKGVTAADGLVIGK